MKIKTGHMPSSGGFTFDFSRTGKVQRHQPVHLVRGLTLALGIGLLAAGTGCVGVVDGGGDGVVVADPGFLWYGDWGWGGGWHGDSRRGAESRGAAHGGGGGGGGGGHAVGHSGGGGGHGGGGKR